MEWLRIWHKLVYLLIIPTVDASKRHRDLIYLQARQKRGNNIPKHHCQSSLAGLGVVGFHPRPFCIVLVYLMKIEVILFQMI